MSAPVIDLAAAQGQKVKFSYTPRGEEQAVEIEGTVDLVNGDAMVLKPKGATMVKLIERHQIVPDTFEVIPEKPKELRAKAQLGTGLSNVRNHLLDRHSYELSVVNNLTDADALREHAEIEHDRLGHYHAQRGEQSVEEEQ